MENKFPRVDFNTWLDDLFGTDNFREYEEKMWAEFCMLQWESQLPDLPRRSKMTEDKEVYKVDDHTKVILTNCKIQCTNCKEWKPASKFGMRHQHNTQGLTIRNQAQCSKCR